MSKWPQQLGADCQNCPLRDRKAVPSEVPKNPRLAVVGEYPSQLGVKLGKPFVGKAGGDLNDVALKKLGEARGSTLVTNATLCAPAAQRRLSDKDWNQAVACCRPRLQRELEALAPNTTVMLLGAKALYSVFNDSRIKKWWGYPVKPRFGLGFRTDLHYMPAFHPLYVLRQPWTRPLYNVTWQRGVAINGRRRKEWAWVWPERVHGDPRRVAEALRHLLDNPPATLAVDVETSRATSVFDVDLHCVGVGTCDVGVTATWPLDPRVEPLMREILASDIPKVLQNCNFDLVVCERNDIPLKGEINDTLPAGCVIYPQGDHDLGTQFAAYEFAPRWKALYHDDDDKVGNAAWASASVEDREDYNGKDCIGTAMLWEHQQRDLKVMRAGWSLYQESMALSRLGKKMFERGVRIDLENRERMRGELLARKDASETRFLEVTGAPGELNIRSSKQLGELFFEQLGAPVRRYSMLTGKPSLDKKSIAELKGHANPAIAGGAKALDAYRGADKLESTYISGLEPREGLVYFSWSPALKLTRRWGSSPNAQNIPADIWALVLPETRARYEKLIAEGALTKTDDKGNLYVRMREGIRNLFIARDGCVWVSADYSQLELRNIGLVFEDEVLIADYEAGLDVHARNACAIFQTDNPTKDQRTFAKNFVFAIAYGGQAKTAWELMVVKFPKIKLEEVEKLQENYFSEHPAWPEFHAKQQWFAAKHGYVEEKFSGHKLPVYDGQVDYNKVINFPVQALASAIMNAAMLRVDAALKSDEHIISCVHDDLIVEVPEERVFETCQLLKDKMETTVEMNGYSMDYIVEPAYGKCWEAKHANNPHGLVEWDGRHK